MPEALSAAALLAALAASLAGSLHCVGMCGPLRLFLPTGRSGALGYQAGRLAAYLALGAALGWLGWALPLWAVAALALAGFAAAFSRRSLPGMSTARARLLAAATARPWLLGLASGLLPCGMLHAWLLAAAATRSPLWGGALLLMLWLGTAPALEGASLALRGPVERARRRFPRAVPAVLLLLALLPLGLRIGMEAWRERPGAEVARPAAVETCPFHP